MAVMIEPRKEEEKGPDADLGSRVTVLEVKLDGLSTKVDEGFKRVDEGFRQVDKRFEQVDKRFEQVDKRFEKIDDRFERMHGLMLHAAIALFGTFITGFGILAGLIIAQM